MIRRGSPPLQATIPRSTAAKAWRMQPARECGHVLIQSITPTQFKRLHRPIRQGRQKDADWISCGLGLVTRHELAGGSDLRPIGIGTRGERDQLLVVFLRLRLIAELVCSLGCSGEAAIAAWLLGLG